MNRNWKILAVPHEAREWTKKKREDYIFDKISNELQNSPEILVMYYRNKDKNKALNFSNSFKKKLQEEFQYQYILSEDENNFL